MLPIAAIAQSVNINGINYYLTPKKVGTATVVREQSYVQIDSVVIPPTVEYEGTVYTVNAIGELALSSYRARYIELPNTIETIGKQGFGRTFGEDRLERTNIPGSVKSIGRNAFIGCSSLKRVDITSLESWMNIDFEYEDFLVSDEERSNPLFYAHHLYLNDEEVTSIEVPAGIKKVKPFTFIGMSELESVSFGTEVTSIGDYAFSKCESLKNIVIPDNIISLGEHAFSDCNSLESFKLSKNLKELPDGLFRNCISLTEVVIPDKVTIVGFNCFEKCKNIKNVFLPSTIKELSPGAFQDCENLENLYCYATNPPEAEYLDYGSGHIDYVFDGSYTDYATLHVPASSIDLYKRTLPWSLFGNIVALTDVETDIDSIIPGEKDTEDYYTLMGTKTDNYGKGVYIKKVNGITKKVLFK